MELRKSRVLSRMRSGQFASCTKLNLADPRVVDLAARLGFDCIWTDIEHVPNTLHDVENQVRAAKIYDVDMLVRVKRGSYSDLIHPFEMDASGIMVPHLMSAEEARQIAYYTKFHPVGRRPIDGGNADGAYCMIPAKEYAAQANRERFVICQIEDPEPMEELDEIAAVEGIDCLFFGPGDYSQGIGLVGEFNHPKVLDARRRVAEVARKHGKFAGTVGSLDNLRELVDMGYQFINIGADVLGLVDYFKHIVEGFERVRGE